MYIKKLKLSVTCFIMNSSATVVFNSQKNFQGQQQEGKKSNQNHKNKIK